MESDGTVWYRLVEWYRRICAVPVQCSYVMVPVIFIAHAVNDYHAGDNAKIFAGAFIWRLALDLHSTSPCH